MTDPIRALTRDTAEVYAKAIERGAELDRIAGAEIRAAMTQPCAPAIRVHRPFCACDRTEQVGTQEVQ